MVHIMLRRPPTRNSKVENSVNTMAHGETTKGAEGKRPELSSNMQGPCNTIRTTEYLYNSGDHDHYSVYLKYEHQLQRCNSIIYNLKFSRLRYQQGAPQHSVGLWGQIYKASRSWGNRRHAKSYSLRDVRCIRCIEKKSVPTSSN